MQEGSGVHNGLAMGDNASPGPDDLTIYGSAPKRRRGRPRVNEPGSSVTTWLRTSDHDRLSALSRAKSRSISSLVRRAVVVFLDDWTRQRR
jgi:hypothetical protein